MGPPIKGAEPEERKMAHGSLLEGCRTGRLGRVAPSIAGLSLTPDFIAEADAAALLARIDAQPWRDDLKRRVQHYGYRYDYKARSIGTCDRLGPLPEWLEPLAARVADSMGAAPDQVIVNEYLPGQGIAPHVDCVPCFGPRIVILSLGSPCVMTFSRGQDRVDLPLPPNSLTVLADAARHDWRHGIAARKSDVIAGLRHSRSRRVSVTFRTVRVSPSAR